MRGPSYDRAPGPHVTLAGNAYREHGVFARGDTATSALLDGVAVDVTALFEDAEG